MSVPLLIGGRNAVLHRGLTDEDLAVIEREWVPLTIGQADEHWPWREIIGAHGGLVLKLTVDGVLVGAILLTPGVPMSSDLDGGLGLLIEYMAGAPWCRSGAAVSGHDKVLAVGPTMVAVTVTASYQLGFKGRLCFFSEVPTVLWYVRKLEGLVSFGDRWDGDRSLPYFEWPGTAAMRFAADYGIPDLKSVL